MKKFVHLHCHSHYSLLDGLTKIDELVDHVRENGMDAVAVTDHGTMAGVVEFLGRAKDAGVKPIVGIEAYVAPGSRLDKKKVVGEGHSYHLTLLARTGEGVRNLMRLSSRAFLEGFYYKPRIDKEILKEHSKGVICLSGCISSEFSDFLMNGRDDKAAELAKWYAGVFGENFYIEIQNNGLREQQEHAAAAYAMARGLGIPVVATSDAHYLKQGDHYNHDILLCVNTKAKYEDANRMRFGTDLFHVRSPDEMYESMEEYSDAVALSQEIADGVEEYYPSLGLGKRCFPSFDYPKREGSPDDYLRKICLEAIQERYGEASDDVTARLEYELGVIARMGYSTYFLVVWDFVRFARSRGIPVAARGSACGAIVSYLLYISNFCPIKHKLLFERFLDPNRSDPPDIDIDICKDRRHEVIEYVTEKYGSDCVAQICNVNTMGPKSVIKDVGRVLGVPLEALEPLCNEISKKLGTTLTNTFESNESFRRMLARDSSLSRVYQVSLSLEDTARAMGTHAAGVVIAPGPLIDLVPLARTKDGTPQTQWTMEDLEKAGLLKMDFLGLRTMTTLGNVIKSIGMDSTTELYRLPLDDEETFELLRRGECKGVFQLDGQDISEIMKRIKPDRFDDIPAVLALYRPGPLDGGVVDDYIARKHGKKKIEYLHESMESVLESTYGIMVYQEQIMQILATLGGLDMSRAYACIKAISKKKPELVAKFKAEFVAGAGRRTNKAEEIFSLIEYFSGYGFNLCVSSDTKIIMTDANEYYHGIQITVEEMYKIKTSEEYAESVGAGELRARYLAEGHYGYGYSRCKDGRVRKNKVVDITEEGVRIVYKISTSYGRSIRVTGNHKFPTPSGDRTTDSLAAGDPLYVRGYVNRCTVNDDYYISYEDKIESIVEDGECVTYNVRMEAPNHNFVVDSGIITCNSHATAYGYVAYQTAYLKAHHPAEFMAAILSSETGGSEREKYLHEHIKDCRFMGIEVIPPDVNTSGSKFRTTQKGGVSFGLSAVKGITPDSASLVEAGQPYSDLRDFVERSGVQKKNVEILIRVGALDSLGKRGPMIAALAGLSASAKSRARDARRGQSLLFDEPPDPFRLPDVPDLDEKEKTEDELNILGFYLRNDPVNLIPHALKAASHKCGNISNYIGTVTFGGVVSEFEEGIVKYSTTDLSVYARFTIRDDTGSVKCVMWPDAYASVRGKMREGWGGVFTGKVDTYKNKKQMVVSRVVAADGVKAAKALSLVIRVDDAADATAMERVKRLAVTRPGRDALVMVIGGETYAAGDKFAVRADRWAVAAMEEILGPGTARIIEK